MFGRGRKRIVEIRKRLAFERLSHNALEGADHIVIFRRDECERVSCALGASRATDAVDVGVGSIRHVVVDDMGNALNIETARCNVGGDHDTEVPGLETAQSLFALSLRAVTMQACDAEPGVGDLPRDLVGTMLGAREDQYGFCIDVLEQFQQQGRLQMGGYGIERVRNRMRRPADTHRDFLRVHQCLRGEQFHLGRESGGEQHGLPLNGHSLDNAPHVGQKAHVEHAVAFVEHQDLDRVEFGITLLDEVEQTAWRCHQNLYAVFQGLDLAVRADSAIDGRAPELCPR